MLVVPAVHAGIAVASVPSQAARLSRRGHIIIGITAICTVALGRKMKRSAIMMAAATMLASLMITVEKSPVMVQHWISGRHNSAPAKSVWPSRAHPRHGWLIIAAAAAVGICSGLSRQTLVEEGAQLRHRPVDLAGHDRINVMAAGC